MQTTAGTRAEWVVELKRTKQQNLIITSEAEVRENKLENLFLLVLGVPRIPRDILEIWILGIWILGYGCWDIRMLGYGC
jgi:hypothetical protein